MKKDENKGGRPRSLTADDRTLATIRGLGKIHATTRECAAVLGVAHQTFLTFAQENPIVSELLESGKALGKMSLRRRQFAEAMKGNTTMLVWLGKQHLDQTDKANINASVTADVTVTDARSALESLIDRQIAAAADQSGAGKPH